MEKSVFVQPLSEQVWFDNYKWDGESSPQDTFTRVSRHVASLEQDKRFYEEKYFELLNNMKFIPGGRILSNAGTGLKGTSYVNCFVSGFRGTNQDSIDSIYSELKRQAKILKSEGGYGCNFSVIRPRGAYINGVGVESPGVIELMNMWDSSSTVITAGSGNKNKNKGKNKIRKGAMMGVLDIWHPSIEEFIIAKQKPGTLTKFNLSVFVSDKFMNALKNNKPWHLIFPDTAFEKYDDLWDGDIEKWQANGYPVIKWKTFESAAELWDLILTSTYNRAEPGVLFGDRINNLNNLNYIERIIATNPCGEQPLQTGGSCVLSSINLVKYLKSDYSDFDYDKLKSDIPYMVRFLDSINDLTMFPLEEQRDEALSKRRIGIGYMGYASSLYFMKIPYGSKKALELTGKLASFITNNIYQNSALLAKEKGAFDLYDPDQYLKSNFIKQALTDDTIAMIKKNGIRNSHLTTVAPTGNSSIFANNVSGGIEPVISHSYIRTVITQNPPESLIMPQNINWDTHSCENKNGWKWILEGDEFLLRHEHESVVYKIDQNRGLTREERVSDYAVHMMKDDFDHESEYAKTLFNLSVDDHIKTMEIFAKYVDSAVSKTVNVPFEYDYENFKNVYLKAYESKVIKGITTYRMGTMTSVVSVESSSEDKTDVENNTSIIDERPVSLPCDLFRISVKGEKWMVFVGLKSGTPYEVFAGKIIDVNLPTKIETGAIIKQKSGVYSFEHDGEILIKNIVKTFESDENESLSRLISTALRHNTPIDFVVEQLSKSKGSVVDFSKSILRALKHYISDKELDNSCPNCGSNLVFIEGCIKCKDCAWSKCG